MRLLVLNDETRAIIRKTRAHAEQNRLSVDKIKELNERRRAVGDYDRRLCCEVPVSYRICFSIEEQPVGFCRHISISVDATGMLPNPQAVEALLEEFGFVGSPQKGGVRCWIEGRRAINVVELADVIQTGETES